MIKNLIDGISIAINENFDAPLVSAEDVTQGIQPGSFMILMNQTTRMPLLMTRRRLEVPFTVHYFPIDPHSNTEMIEAAHVLEDVLEIITDTNGYKYLGHDTSFVISDHVLLFNTTYTLILQRVDEIDLMQHMDQYFRGSEEA